MSYQVNWRIFVPDCEYWEGEALSNLTEQIQAAVKQIVVEHLGKGKQVTATSAEVVYLNK